MAKQPVNESRVVPQDGKRSRETGLVDSMSLKKPIENSESLSIASQLRRHEQVEEAKRSGQFETLYRSGKLIPLPQDEELIDGSAVADAKHYVTDGDAVVVVLTYGKIASLAVSQSIRSHKPEGEALPTYHIHLFRHDTISETARRQRNTRIPGHLVTGAALRRVYDRWGGRLRWKFIAGVRDPIASGLSRYFYEAYSVGDTVDVETVLPFLRTEPEHAWSHFEREYLEGLRIDCRGTPDLIARGYRIVRRENVEVLIYKTEALSDCFVSAVEEFLGIESIELLRVHETINRPGGDTYRKVVADIRLPADLVHRIYSRPLCQTFYSPEELAGFKKRWTVTPKARLSTL